MKFEEAIEQLVDQGAIRMARMSSVWYIAYRMRAGVIEARGLHQASGEWGLADQLPSAKPASEGEGWFHVAAIPSKAEPIDSEAAKSNAGYFIGLIRQCYTCKQDRPLSWFVHSESDEGYYRSWECKQCSGQRSIERRSYLQSEDEHLGDYQKDRNKTSRPPVPSEI